MSSNEKTKVGNATDALTGLMLSDLISDHLIQQPQCGIIILDIDTFRVFTACYGYQESDAVLKDLAQTLQRMAPEQCHIFRSAGDEFTILMKYLPINQLLDFAFKLSKTIKAQFAHYPAGKYFYLIKDKPSSRIQSIPLTVSCGVALYPDHGNSYVWIKEAIYQAWYIQGKREVVTSLQL